MLPNFKICLVSCLVLSVLSATAFATGKPAFRQEPQGRTTIDIANDKCGFLARTDQTEFVYEHACAQALSTVSVSKWMDQRNDWELGAHLIQGDPKDVNLYVINVAMADYRLRPVFHSLARGRFLLEVPCRSAAYNATSIFFAYDKSRLPASVEPILFPQADGAMEAEIGSRGVDARRGLIVEYSKTRGMGDAGYYARYSIDPATFKVTLLEAIKKDDVDGKDLFRWTGRFDAKPRGKTWTRIFP